MYIRYRVRDNRIGPEKDGLAMILAVFCNKALTLRPAGHHWGAQREWRSFAKIEGRWQRRPKCQTDHKVGRACDFPMVNPLEPSAHESALSAEISILK